MDHPHPLVPAATAVWHRPGYDTGKLDDWRATLPRSPGPARCRSRRSWTGGRGSTPSA
ncbi:hypothetical protein JNW88_21725 [Micromonospora sp. ATA32]|nr:hypothetical protein [Micromonospora sp. ATA32]